MLIAIKTSNFFSKHSKTLQQQVTDQQTGINLITTLQQQIADQQDKIDLIEPLQQQVTDLQSEINAIKVNLNLSIA